MNTTPKNLKDVFEDAFTEIKELHGLISPKLTLQEVGTITTVSTGIVNVSGLHSVGFEEVVKFPNDVLGIAFNVDEEEIGVVLLDEYSLLHAGDKVERTGRVMDLPVDE